MTLHRDGLTDRELEVVEHLIDTGSVKGTADSLGLADQTVKNYLLEARRKTHSLSNVQLVYALVTGEFND